MEHYFIEKETLPQNERELKFSFNGRAFVFRTNNGLFSYKEVDYASRLLMENVPELTGTLLDMGCGYGAIGITLAKIYGLSLTLCDVNASALRYAQMNAEINGVSAEFIHSDGFDSVIGLFDTIVTNPPVHAGKETVFKIYRQAAQHIKTGGALYTVIQKKHGAESHIKILETVYGEVSPQYKKKGYFVLRTVV